ncbi:MAG: NAD(P)H-dependent oxidoreductase subunit E [Pseudomonadota bacterium]
MIQEKTAAIIDKYNADRESLIMMMQDIQDTYRHLPQEALRYLADKMDIPLTQIYAVATFYKAFSLTPQGEHMVHVCCGTACHVKGADRIVSRMERELHIKEGGTTLDGKYTLKTVRCVGACSLAPIVIVDENVHGRLNQDKAVRLVRPQKTTAAKEKAL